MEWDKLDLIYYANNFKPHEGELNVGIGLPEKERHDVKRNISESIYKSYAQKPPSRFTWKASRSDNGDQITKGDPSDLVKEEQTEEKEQSAGRTGGLQFPPVYRAPEKPRIAYPFSDRVVPESFRDNLVARFPTLGSDRALMRLADLLIFGGMKDATSDELLLCGSILAGIEGEERAYNQRRYRGERLLEQFRSEIAPGFAWRAHDWSPSGESRCRRVAASGLSLDLYEDASRIRLLPISRMNDPVVLATGERWSRRIRAREREKLREKASALEGLARHGETRRLLGYLNGLPPNAFTKGLRRMEKARDFARTDPKLAGESAKWAYLHGALQAIERQPQPFYKPSNDSPRVFGIGRSVLNVPSRYRPILYPDWLEFDLRSAHLAVCAIDWGVGEVEAFLRSGASIWEHLIGLFGSRGEALITRGGKGYKEVKGALKVFLYALVYGMGKRKLAALGDDEQSEERRATLERAFGTSSEEIGERLMADGLVRAMLEARQREMDRVHRTPVVRDCFGTRIRKDGWDSYGSVLSQEAQAVELALLLPALDLAVEEEARAREAGRSTDFRITLWQHDGFSVSFSDRTKRERYSRRIKEAVDLRCRELGYPTELEIG